MTNKHSLVAQMIEAHTQSKTQTLLCMTKVKNSNHGLPSFFALWVIVMLTVLLRLGLRVNSQIHTVLRHRYESDGEFFLTFLFF